MWWCSDGNRRRMERRIVGFAGIDKEQPPNQVIMCVEQITRLEILLIHCKTRVAMLLFLLILFC